MMLVLSSPSGAGKSTISRLLLEGDGGLAMSVSTTTRRPRPGEEEGRDYNFVDKAAFDRMKDDGAFLEHAQVFGNQYGTPRAPVEEALKSGADVLFDVDWQGARQLKKNAAGDVVGVFILPPSTAELERRLKDRAQDSEDIVRQRMSTAIDEMSHWDEYDYVIVNENVEESVARVHAIVKAERSRRERQSGLADFVAELSQGN